MQLRHLRYFVRIVEAGSFSRAAATIHVAQPALSQQIAELEEELGVILLHRSERGVRPTEAGETLYREAAVILQLMEQLPGKVRSTGGETEGAVNLGMTSTLAAFISGPFMEACRAASRSCLPRRVPLRPLGSPAPRSIRLSRARPASRPAGTPWVRPSRRPRRCATIFLSRRRWGERKRCWLLPAPIIST